VVDRLAEKHRGRVPDSSIRAGHATLPGARREAKWKEEHHSHPREPWAWCDAAVREALDLLGGNSTALTCAYVASRSVPSGGVLERSTTSINIVKQNRDHQAEVP